MQNGPGSHQQKNVDSMAIENNSPRADSLSYHHALKVLTPGGHPCPVWGEMIDASEHCTFSKNGVYHLTFWIYRSLCQDVFTIQLHQVLTTTGLFAVATAR